ncbi:MAG TPA: hypothetical protein VGE06_02635, partial [Flavisolibacter sp.]
LDKIAEFIIHTLSAKRVLLFGGSAGGFASLYYSRQIKKSLALIWNPQTILNNYYKHLVSRYSYLAYDCSLQNLSKHMVTNIPEFYKKVHGNNRIIYMQNVSDHHVETHLKPFLQIIGRDVPKNEYSQWIDENLYLHISNWSEGHTPPPRKTLQQLLEKFCQPSFEWTSENIALAMAEAEASANTAKN